MKLTYYGHACFLLETQGKRILFDPFISPNELASSIDVDAIQADYILISHGHADHIADAEAIAERTGAIIVSNYEIVSWYEQKGLKNLWPMNHGGTKSFDFGKVKYVNAIHSSVLPDGTYGGNPGGFVIQNSEGCLYFAGDTALTTDMELLGRYLNIDWAILPIGDNFTMGIEDAVICADMIQCDQIIGMHFDTFPFIKIDHKYAADTFSAANKKLHLLTIGDTSELK